jgi:putative ABC transport system ATP-binding protein
MNDPEIILADEPVGNLDSKNAQTVLELLALINTKEKKTVIQVTHNPKDTKYADRVFYMKDGVIERVAVNTDVGRAAPSHGGELTELEKIEQANPNLSATELHAKFIVRTLLMPYDIDTEQKIEKEIARYIRKEISKDEMVRFMDDPKKGAGLYSQKAKRIGESVAEIVREIESITAAQQKSSAGEAQHFESQSAMIRRHLLDTYHGTLTAREIHELEQAIELRIEGTITGPDFQEFLHASRAKGGLELPKATAKKFSKYLELLISK